MSWSARVGARWPADQFLYRYSRGVDSGTGGSARVRMAEVADACGVSRMTVSNAYNRPDQLSAGLRRRILDTAETLGYGGPSPAGRVLKRGRSDVLGVLLAEALPSAFGDPGTLSFLHGVTAGAAEGGLSLQLIPAGGPDAGSRVRDAAVDGLIAFAAADGDPALESALARHLPTVVAGGPRGAGCACVTIDNRAAAASAAAHVADLGHGQVAMVTWRLRGDGYCGEVDRRRLGTASFEVARERTLGWLEVLGERRKLRGAPVLWEQPGNTAADGLHAGLALLRRASGRPTAVLAATDVLALGVLQAARGLGLEVPGEVSVVGFDDIEEAGRARPALTTVSQPLYEQGRDCASLLIDAARLAAAGEATILHDTCLVVRSSTGRVGPW